jgi:hypothetical protein
MLRGAEEMARDRKVERRVDCEHRAADDGDYEHSHQPGSCHAAIQVLRCRPREDGDSVAAESERHSSATFTGFPLARE